MIVNVKFAISIEDFPDVSILTSERSFHVTSPIKLSKRMKSNVNIKNARKNQTNLA